MESLPRIALPERFNVASELLEGAREADRGARTAFVCGDRSHSLAEVAELADRAGSAFAELGLELEQRIVLLCLDSIEFVASFLGAIEIGAVPVPLNTLWRPRDLVYALNDSRAKVLVVHRALWEPLAPLRDELPFLRHVLVIGEPADGTRAFGELLAARGAPLAPDPAPAPVPLAPAPTRRDDPAFWLYSSGSTGAPKAAVHLQQDMIFCAELYARGVLGLRADDVVLSAAKLFFAYGLGNSLTFPLRLGATSVLYPERATPEAMFELLAAHRATIFFGVPTLYAAMLQVPGAETRYDLSALRLCVSAGEALPSELYHRFRERFGVEILDGIGSTEALHIFISNRAGEVRPGASGRLVPGYEARILDDDGARVPPGEIGNLWIKGQSTAPGYFGQRAKSQSTMVGEWLNTGDKYAQDSEGFFHYAGRSDDMLKVGGIWVSPVEVENTLIQHDAVLEAAVVGQADGDELVKPKAFVVLKPGRFSSTALGEELQAFVKGRLAPYKYPRWVEFVAELPKTATGKIQRFKLRG